MNVTDKTEFAELILAVSEIYGRALSPAALDVYWSALTRFSITDVRSAMNHHVNNPEAGQYFPKPADLIRAMGAGVNGGGYPGPDEAWGMLLRVIRDERETGVLTQEMREGWSACQPILDEGDEVGARKCFLEVYANHVDLSLKNGRVARWEVTLGTDQSLREHRLSEAVQRGRITQEHAKSLLPGPAPVSIDHVAGLLEGPGATKSDFDVAAKLRGLAQALRQGLNDSRDREREERERQRAEEASKKRDIQRLLDERGYGASDSEEAA